MPYDHLSVHMYYRRINLMTNMNSFADLFNPSTGLQVSAFYANILFNYLNQISDCKLWYWWILC